MTEHLSDRSDAILLDIEGTTTSVEYVFGVLFPFAKVRVDTFLQTHAQEIVEPMLRTFVAKSGLLSLIQLCYIYSKQANF